MKKLFSGVLAVILLLGSFSAFPASAADTVQEQTYENILSALNIMNGYEDGTFGLDNTLTRAEFAKLAVKASSLKDSVPESVYFSPFSDVGYTNWAAPVVSVASKAGYMVGYSGGSFKPNQQVKLEEAVTTVLRLLGYGDSDFPGAYPAPQLALAGNLGLLKNVSATQGKPVTRRDAMYLFYNLLQSKTKTGGSYISIFGFSTVDYGSIIDKSMAGPITVKSLNWYSGTGVREKGVKVYKNGKLIGLSDISVYDIVYYSAGMNTVWVYSNQVTGQYEKAEPDPSYPTSVSVAGNTYAFETTEAAGTMSTFGSYKIGDTVTLLLGKNGKIADVVPLASGDEMLYGVLTAAGESAYTDAAGTQYAGYYATVFLPDGSSSTYRASQDYSNETGSVMSVKFTDGKASLQKVGGGGVSGTVSVSGNRIGTSVIGGNLKVVEVGDKTAPRTVYIDRLDGVTLEEENVLYAAADGGVVSALFITGVTNDAFSYGYLKKAVEGSTSGTYTFDVGGAESTVTTQNVTFGLTSTGPSLIQYDNQSKITLISRLTRLNETVSSLTGTTLETSGGTYKLADNTVFYIKTGAIYQYSTLAKVQASGLELKAYYDKPQAKGGRIRVIVAG